MLLKVATKGVVTLFNAVNKQQKNIQKIETDKAQKEKDKVKTGIYLCDRKWTVDALCIKLDCSVLLVSHLAQTGFIKLLNSKSKGNNSTQNIAEIYSKRHLHPSTMTSIQFSREHLYHITMKPTCYSTLFQAMQIQL